VLSHEQGGAGTIEKRIAELFAATTDRALSIADVADNAYGLGGRPATREQRLSATRAAHRLIRRIKEAHEQALKLFDESRREAEEIFGHEVHYGDNDYDEFDKTREALPISRRAEALWDFQHRFGSWTRWVGVGRDQIRVDSEEFWRATAKDRRIYFHRPDVPVEVYAVSVQPAGVIWAEAEIRRITERNVTVRYAGATARLDRESLWKSWAVWRGVIFVSSRTGRPAQRLDDLWQRRYGRASGGVPPVMQMPLAEAMALLKVSADYTRPDVLAAFRREVKLRQLVEARDRLLAALGTSAPAPKPPTYYPSGSKITYRRASSIGHPRLGHTRLIA
jgi:hypothetical protein